MSMTCIWNTVDCRLELSSSSPRRKDEPTVDTTVHVQVSRDAKNSTTTNSSSRINDGKTPRKQNHTKSKKKKNSIDPTIDDMAKAKAPFK
eukprot:scaffold13668_cov132-Skeletonema_marinoi.AAC.1